MEREPISQAWMLELMDQKMENVTEAHGRVRQSLNEMKVEMKSGFDRMTTKQDQNEARLGRHSERLLVIETARKVEERQTAEDKQRISNRNILGASLTSTIITIAIFIIKAILHL